MKKLDELFSKLLKYGVRGKTGFMQYFKSFPNGISNLSNLTGRDFLTIIQLLPFAILNSGESLMPNSARIKMLELLRLVHMMCWYIFKTEMWTPEVRVRFKKLVEDFTLLCHQP